MTDMTDPIMTKEMFADLKKDVDYLMQKRLIQQDIVPDIIKTRAMGEANRYIFSGLAAARPNGAKFGNSTRIYFATDTNVLSVWNGTAWKSVTLL